MVVTSDLEHSIPSHWSPHGSEPCQVGGKPSTIISLRDFKIAAASKNHERLKINEWVSN